MLPFSDDEADVLFTEAFDDPVGRAFLRMVLPSASLGRWMWDDAVDDVVVGMVMPRWDRLSTLARVTTAKMVSLLYDLEAGVPSS